MKKIRQTLWEKEKLTILFNLSRLRDKVCTFYLIAKIYLYNFDPLKPHFYRVKLGFTGVYIFSYFCSET